MEGLDWLKLGNALREKREAIGMPVETAAHQLCLAKSQIVALEAGKAANFPGAQARLWCTRRYAELLSLDINDFVSLPESSGDIDIERHVAPSAMPKRWQSWLPTMLLASMAGAYVWLVDKISTEPAPAFVAPPPPVVAAPVPAEPHPPVAPVAPESKPVQIEEDVKSIDVQGIDPNKSSRYVYVSAQAPAVLLKRNGATGQEDRIELAKGSSMRIALVSGDKLRVIEGRDLNIFFQGRKAPPQAIEQGLWLRFRAR